MVTSGNEGFTRPSEPMSVRQRYTAAKKATSAAGQNILSMTGILAKKIAGLGKKKR
jgi:hypothetical protein